MNVEDIYSINHVGVIVRDLDQAKQTYGKLGFSFTPISIHSGAEKPGGPIVNFGTGNMSIMFPKNYIEILANIDKSKKYELNKQVNGWLAKHEGIHLICLGCENADTVNKRWEREGLETTGVIPLQRDVDTPEGLKTARFSRTVINEKHNPEGQIQAAYHHNPEYIHQERYSDHPNQATGVVNVIICVENAEKNAKKHAQITGYPSKRIGDFHIVQLPYGRITLVSQNDAKRLLPEVIIQEVPSMIGVGYATKDINSVRSVLKSNGIPNTESDNKIYVSPKYGCGSLVVFEEYSE